MLLVGSCARAYIGLKPVLSYTCRRYHAPTSSLRDLDAWIASPKRLVQYDTFESLRLADLYITLPTRDGTPHSHVPTIPSHPAPVFPPRAGDTVPYGHHLAFFHPRTPEALLRPDGTDAEFCPPEPFVRRMWAGGRMEWHSPVKVGADACAVSTIAGVEKKGFDAEGKTPMVFVKQHIEIRDSDDSAALPNVIEERTHVYLPLGLEQRRVVRKLEGLPKPDFSFSYTPTLTTLFRFSALTFNGHHIHLDKDYAQNLEGYPERLVHGPLTALMMLETLAFHKPGVRMKTFEYRAVNPVIVNRPCIIQGTWEGTHVARLWAEDGDGVVGMTGSVTFD